MPVPHPPPSASTVPHALAAAPHNPLIENMCKRMTEAGAGCKQPCVRRTGKCVPSQLAQNETLQIRRQEANLQSDAGERLTKSAGYVPEARGFLSRLGRRFRPEASFRRELAEGNRRLNAINQAIATAQNDASRQSERYRATYDMNQFKKQDQGRDHVDGREIVSQSR